MTVFYFTYLRRRAVPARWTQPLHVPLPGFDGRVLRLAELLRLAHRLGG